jgi:hypothetical protein
MCLVQLGRIFTWSDHVKALNGRGIRLDLTTASLDYSQRALLRRRGGNEPVVIRAEREEYGVARRGAVELAVIREGRGLFSVSLRVAEVGTVLPAMFILLSDLGISLLPIPVCNAWAARTGSYSFFIWYTVPQMSHRSLCRLDGSLGLGERRSLPDSM